MQLLRVLILYLEKAINSHARDEKGVVRKGFRVLFCCLSCIESCLKYLNKNAYILVINRGYGLLRASLHVFQLLSENIAIVTSLNVVYSLFIWFEKLAVCIL